METLYNIHFVIHYSSAISTRLMIYNEILFSYRSVDYSTPQQVIVALPNEARTPAVQLGWWQITETETGAFAIDNVLVGPSSYDFGSIYNDTCVTMH